MSEIPAPPIFRGLRGSPILKQEELILDVSEQIWGYMDSHRIKSKVLASRMKCSEGHISQLLNGSRNLTLRTLSDMAHHLGAEVTISIKEPK